MLTFKRSLNLLGISAIVVGVILTAACSGQGSTVPPFQQSTTQIDQPASTTTSDVDGAFAGIERYFQAGDTLRARGGIPSGENLPVEITQTTVGEERTALTNELVELYNSGTRMEGKGILMERSVISSDQVPTDVAPAAITLFTCVDRTALRRQPGNTPATTGFTVARPEMVKDSDGLWKVTRISQKSAESC